MGERAISIDCGSIHARLWGPIDQVETVVLLHGGRAGVRIDAVAISDSITDEMKQLIVRNVGEETVRALKQRAARHGTSAEAEHRTILREALRSDIDRASFKHILASMPDAGLDEDFVVVRDMPRDSA